MWLGGYIVVVAAVGLMQVTILFMGDWLIRPEHRRALAFATALTWAMWGSGLLTLAIKTFQARDLDDKPIKWWALGIVLAIGTIASYAMAFFRWQKANAKNRE